MSKRFIVKIQRPISGTDTDTILFYNEDRTIKYMKHNPSKELIKLFGTQYKIYRYAKLSEDNQIVVEEEAPWQNW